jgi:REP element-mobilizing transposase RayT
VSERAFEPGSYYHVGSRANFGHPIFSDARLNELYLDRYEIVAAKYDWTTLDWTLLWNHTHFLIRLGECGLSRGMQELNSWFARRLNLIHGQTGKGHVFRHRFHAAHLKTDAHLMEVCRYIPLNAPRADQCKRPEEWRWGGFRANVGLEHPRTFHAPNELLLLFGKTPPRARRHYRKHVRAGLDPGGHVSSSNDGGNSAT